MSRTKKDTSLGSLMGYGFIQFEIHLRQQYVNHMETHFEQELKIIENNYDEFMTSLEDGDSEELSDEAKSHYEDTFIDDFFMIKKVYRKTFRDSQVIQLYSFLEDLLMKGCSRYASIKKTHYKVTDLNGQNDIDRIKKYLSKSVGIDFGTLSADWSFLDNLRAVRNQVVHHNGIIKNNDLAKGNDKKFNKIEKFSTDRFTLEPYLGSSNKFQIIFDNPKFIISILEHIESLVQNIARYEVD